MTRFSRWRWSRAAVKGAVVGLFAALAAVLGAAGYAVNTVSPSATPASASQYERKVTICHRTRSSKRPFVTIRVSRRAVPAHLRHGDGIGPCPRAQFTLCHKNKKTGKAKTIKVRGLKALRKHARHKDRLGPCPKAKRKGKPRPKK